MSTTLKAIRRRMVALLEGNALGRVVTPASFTTTTAVVNSLNFGSLSSDDFTGLFMTRADAATSAGADRVRRVSSYAASTGTLTHTGSNYADTTATGETLELLQYEPFLYDGAINVTLNRLLRRDRTVFPTVAQQTIYSLWELPWIQSPGDIDSVWFVPSPIITRDRYFEKWNTVDTSGNLNPDWWTLTGSGATVTRSQTQLYDRTKHQYSTALVRSGTNATLAQTPGLGQNGTPQSNAEDRRGKQFTAVLVCWASSASQIRVQWTDGTQTVSSSYHTGNSTWQELIATGTIATTATGLTVQASIETTDGTTYLSQMYGLEGTLTDSARRDGYDVRGFEVPKRWYDQSQASPALVLDARSRNGQYVVYSKRPYPQFDATRLAAGTADGDSTDAPEIVVATMAIGRLFEGLAYNKGEDTSRYQAIAADWTRRGQRLAMEHFAAMTQPKGGAPIPQPQFGLPARRF